MSDLPDGTVTFMFTDIEGSTRRWETDAAAMEAALARHDELLVAAVQAHGGHVFKTVGDAVFAVFSDAPSAIDAAITGQRALHDYDWHTIHSEFEMLRIRVGIHTGDALLRGGDYFGPCVNRVARLAGAGHGGQILISGTTSSFVSDGLPSSIELRDWGNHRLRDLRHSERIFQIVPPDLPDNAHAPRTVQALEPADRIVVDSDDGDAPATAEHPSDDDHLLRELLETVRSDDRVATLSGDQARRLARRLPSDLTEYRLSTIAEWAQPQYRLDQRFVDLSVLTDQGEDASGERWQTDQQRHASLGDALSACESPSVVLLGAPGSGKSTLLRQLDLETAIRALRDGADRVSLFVPLNHYWPERASPDPPDPGDWLLQRWRSQHPALPSLDRLLDEGRVTLLLDGLNEMPHGTQREYRALVQLWKRFLHSRVSTRDGNLVVFSCRSLDYSATLSSRELRVPQLNLEPLTDEQVRRFLHLHCPAHAREVWQEIHQSPQLELMRSPFYLKLMIEQVSAGGSTGGGKAALFTGCVRQSLSREIERDNPLFEPNGLLTHRDVRQIVQNSRWATEHALPERGHLVGAIGQLAFGMQHRASENESSQVRVAYDEACRLIGHESCDDVLLAGEALGVVSEDTEHDQILFAHQLLQEYFAARRVAREPDLTLARSAWREEDVSPSLTSALKDLAPADPLPLLPSTRWDETFALACAMSASPTDFVTDLMDENLPLAGRCAAQSGVNLTDECVALLRNVLVDRSRSRSADLRARIACGLALGQLGDPRLERRHGEYGPYALTPMVSLEAAAYPIGVDEASGNSHSPGHTVHLDAFGIGRFPVTVAEWSCFIAADGYDDDRWWDTEAARCWQQGEGTAHGARIRERKWRVRFQADPERLEALHREGKAPQAVYEGWQERLRLSDSEFEQLLRERYPSGRLRQPDYWDRQAFTNPAQPVVGVSWFEARAYCCWLSAQCGLRFRLPTEAEWEAAARGRDGRPFAWGNESSEWHCNTVESHVRGTVPVGVFPLGDTPEGIADMCGNIWEWTSTVWGPDADSSTFGCPYDALDGREDPAAPAEDHRVLRGGSWANTKHDSHAYDRARDLPDMRGNNGGFRLALTS